MNRLQERLETFLGGLKTSHAERVLRPVQPEAGGVLRREGRELLNFSSNNYLGLATHPLLITRAQAWTRSHGAGATASRLVCGTFDLHEKVESRLAALKGTETALILNSGFQANAAVLPALFDRSMLGRDPLVFTDRLNHASLHHGCLAAGVRQIRFRHNDLDHLEQLLSGHAGQSGQRFILTESVFSMDGDRAEMEGLLALAERFDAFLYVDEAHATGVLGPGGMGLTSAFPGRFDLVMGTFSKALGGFGAYIACSHQLKAYLINRCAGFLYSTALPPAVLGAMDAALELVPSLEAERAQLHANADRLREGLRKLGLDYGNSTTQIVPAILGDAARTLEASKILEAEGILAIPIRPPTVPAGTSRIRFAVSAMHGPAEMDRLLAALPRMAAVTPQAVS
ncbi:MAG: 8-amino-7-oxononanoate synthase [Alphaproteobacteria bacterium]